MIGDFFTSMNYYARRSHQAADRLEEMEKGQLRVSSALALETARVLRDVGNELLRVHNEAFSAHERSRTILRMPKRSKMIRVRFTGV